MQNAMDTWVGIDGWYFRFSIFADLLFLIIGNIIYRLGYIGMNHQYFIRNTSFIYTPEMVEAVDSALNNNQFFQYILYNNIVYQSYDINVLCFHNDNKNLADLYNDAD